jgi:glycerol uptake facilitator-like aquaporin
MPQVQYAASFSSHDPSCPCYPGRGHHHSLEGISDGGSRIVRTHALDLRLGNSDLQHLSLSAFSYFSKSFLMGCAVAGVTFLIIRSPFGRRTGAHFNPALTLTYFFLGRIPHWDAIFYILFQFSGAVIGVFIARVG